MPARLLRSLSTSTARAPSMKSGWRANAIDSSNSIARHSRSDLPRAPRISSNEVARAAGLNAANAASPAAARQLGEHCGELPGIEARGALTERGLQRRACRAVRQSAEAPASTIAGRCIAQFGEQARSAGRAA